MEQYLDVLSGSPLFDGAGVEDIRLMLDCLGASERRFQRGTAILRAGAPAESIGVVLAGVVQVCREDAEGRRTLLACLEPGDLFGEAYACAGAAVLPVSVWAASEAAVLLLDRERLLGACPAACPYHTVLIRNLLSVLAGKNVFLSRRVEHLSKRTLREKLLSYLEEQSALAGGGVFSVPLDRQGLADYLCADRSALSRELGRLKAEGKLDYDRSSFRLL